MTGALASGRLRGRLFQNCAGFVTPAIPTWTTEADVVLSGDTIQGTLTSRFRERVFTQERGLTDTARSATITMTFTAIRLQ